MRYFCGAICALVALSASAQVDRVGQVEVGVGWGRLFSGTMATGSNAYYDYPTKVDDGVMKGFWLTARLPHDSEIEIAVRRTPTHITTAHAGVFPNNPFIDGLDFASIEALYIHGWQIGRFAPYAGLGGGITNLDIDAASSAIQDSNRFAFSAAIGARYFLVPHFGVRFDVRERATILNHGHWVRTPEVLAGPFLTFGGNR